MSGQIYLPLYELYDEPSSFYDGDEILRSEFCNLAKLNPKQTKFFNKFYGPHPQITDYSNAAAGKIVNINTKYGKIFTSFGNYNNILVYDLNLETATDCSQLFFNCPKLKYLSFSCNSLPTSILQQAFVDCGNLETIDIKGSIKVDSNDLDFSGCTKLTVDSLLKILYSLENNSYETTTYTYTVTLGPENLAKLTDVQKAIATNKNIALA